MCGLYRLNGILKKMAEQVPYLKKEAKMDYDKYIILFRVLEGEMYKARQEYNTIKSHQIQLHSMRQ